MNTMVIAQKTSSNELTISGLPIIVERHVTLGKRQVGSDIRTGGGKKYSLLSQYGSSFGGMPAILRTPSGDRQVNVTVRVTFKGHGEIPRIDDVGESAVNTQERDALLASL
jgi:hypothetical protein